MVTTELNLEFKYDDGFEFEQVVAIETVQEAIQEQVNQLTRNAEKFIIEEVYGVGEHYYQLYR